MPFFSVFVFSSIRIRLKILTGTKKINMFLFCYWEIHVGFSMKHTSDFFIYYFKIFVTFQTADEADNRKKNRVRDVF